MNKTIKLGEVASIQSGYSFRGAIVNDSQGKLGVVQARDITGLEIDDTSLARLNQHLADRRLLLGGDILLTSRGSFRSAVANFIEPTVASSSLFVIRLGNSQFLPHYVAIFLNADPAQYYFQQNARGATIQSLTVDSMRGIRIPVLPVSTQQIIVDLYNNIAKQQTLLNRKQELIGDIFRTAITKTLEGAIK